MNLVSIGTVVSPYKEKFITPRQPNLVHGVRGEIQLTITSAETMLEGIEDYSHIWVLFGFNLNSNLSLKTKVKPPRLGGEKIGVFATRTPHRPNPIGLSVLKLIEKKNNSLIVEGLDIVDGSPVYDIKPYISSYDRVDSVEKNQYNDTDYEVVFDCEEKIEDSNLKNIIIEHLKLDPRPLAYRNEKFLGFRYWFYYDKWNIGFEFNGNTFIVKKIEPIV